MTRNDSLVDRCHIRTKTAYAVVIDALKSSIGRPHLKRISQQLQRPWTDDELARLLKGALAGTELIEFTRLAVGPPTSVSSSVRGYRVLRLTIGSPLVMNELTTLMLEAGWFAPITFLIYEQNSTVHLVYDRITSLFSERSSMTLSPAAEIIDSKITRLLNAAARGEKTAR